MSVEQRAYFLRKAQDWKDRSSRKAARPWRSFRSTRCESRHRRPRLERDRLVDRTSHPRSPAQADRQDRCRIRRLYDGEYGYCEVTGEPISLARLEARPIATMTLEAQEKHERIERVSRDD